MFLSLLFTEKIRFKFIYIFVIVIFTTRKLACSSESVQYRGAMRERVVISMNMVELLF